MDKMKTFTGKDLEIAKAVAEWLQSNNLKKSYDSLIEETGLVDIPNTKVLEKKWGSILIMQKKVNELENKIKTMKEEYEQAALSGVSYTKSLGNSNGLPKQPEKFKVNGHRAAISSLAFHPVFNMIASSSDDASIIIWDCSDSDVKQDQYIRAHTNAINQIVFDTNGKLLASCSSDMGIKIWKFDNPMKCLKTLTGHEHLISSIEFSSDSNFLFSASRDKTIKQWDVSSGFCKNTYKAHDDWVRSISLNDKSSLLVSCSDDETIIVWNVDKCEIKNQITGHNNKIEQVLFVKSEESKRCIFTGDYQSNSNMDKEKDESSNKVSELNKKLFDTSQLSKKIDKEYVFSCSRDKTIKLWDISNSTCIYIFEGHDNWVRSMILHSSGKYLISTGDDKSIRIWELKNGRCAKKLEKVHDKFIVALSMHSSMGLLASGSNDLSIKFWDCK